MSALKKRAYALESEFAYQQEFQFKAQARSNALLGLWAASAMRRPDADLYSREIAVADIDAPGSALARVGADLRSAGIDCSDDELRVRMVTMLKNVSREMHDGV